MAKKLIPHTSCSHTHRHTKTQLIHQRHIGHLGHFLFTQKPLGKVVQSNTNTFSVVSEEELHLRKTAKSEAPKVNHSRWGVTEHEVRTTNMPTRCSPKVAYSLSVREASVPFNKNKSQSCSLFFFLPLMASLTDKRTVFQICFLDSFCSLSLPPAQDTVEEMKRTRDISTSLL